MDDGAWEERADHIGVEVVLDSSYPRVAFVVARGGHVERSGGLLGRVDHHCLTGKGIGHSLCDQKGLGKRKTSGGKYLVIIQSTHVVIALTLRDLAGLLGLCIPIQRSFCVVGVGGREGWGTISI